ncbi:MAG: energy transducer TonB [Rhodospirillales bacterium]|nr:energy transducer TonB [Rhodospirillales bacterium]
MRTSILYSILLHAAIVAVTIYGLPAIRKPPTIQDIPIVVEVVEITAKTSLPSKQELKPKPEEKKLEVKPPPPPPKVEKAPPQPAPQPEPEAVAAAPPPKPKPKEKPKPKPKPKPKSKAKPKPKAPVRLAKAKPRRKPRPPDQFASLLKNLEQDLRKSEPKKKAKVKKKDKPKTDFQELISKSLARRTTGHDPSERITLSERDALVNAIKRQLEPCWNLPAGAKSAGDMVIEIKVSVNPDGKVRTADLINAGRINSDSFYRASAESALRAVNNPRCNHLKLPPDKYNVWKDLTLTFNPRDML